MVAAGRNDVCPCGSGKKYKNCCLGKTDAAAPDILSEALEQALQYHQTGRQQEAADLYQQILQIQPDHTDALHLLGLLAHQDGQHGLALELIERAIELAPEVVLYRSNIGPVYMALGRLEEARACYAEVIRRQPEYVEAHNNLGHLLDVLGQPDEAQAHFRKAIEIKPDYAEAHYNLGRQLRKQGRAAEAIACCREALRYKPDFPDAHNNLGLLLAESGQLEEALQHYQAALVQQPQHAETHNNLACLLRTMGRPGEAAVYAEQALAIRPSFAEAMCTLGNLAQDQGKLDEALVRYQQASQVNPAYTEAWYNMGCVLSAQGKRNEAASCYRQAITLQPGHAAAYNNLGVLLRESGQHLEAIEASERAIALAPDFAEPYVNIGNALSWLGRSGESVQAYRKALELKPDHAVAWSNLLLTLLYDPALTPQEVFAESLRFGECFETPLKPGWPQHANLRDPERRLKIGYVSADLREHALAYFIEPILANHDKQRFEVYCYHNHPQQDAMTARLRSLADHWRQCERMSDEQLDAQIRADGIDILIDLSGHTAGNRLPVFARKPAPVQINWIGYIGTSGLEAMDYRITDVHLDPPGLTEAIHSERLLYLPAAFTFRSDPQAPPVNSLPSLGGEPFTFASLNNPSKLNDRVVALWSRILKGVPHSRLMLGNMQEGQARWLLQMFAAHGVDAARLELLPRVSLQEYLAAHHRIDLALDPFPYNGGTTTNYAMWMGVPVVVLAGDRPISRVGVCNLMRAGLPEFVAASEDEYVEIAVRNSRDPNALNELRQSLRSRILSSSVIDAAAYTGMVEDAFRRVWREWCRKDAA